MSSEPAIAVREVSKRFRLLGGGRTLKSTTLDALRGGARRQGNDFWALRNVDFEVAHGETLGLIGANGAGKSTLLAIVAGTMFPTSGTVQTQGAISSLLELGAGFHPDLSGRENVYLLGAIMGISREQMGRRFDAIVDFAELRDYIDEPVRHYSSGMYVRLGFAVSVEVDPDVLLIDEVLAVGDEVFQRKCIERMDAFRRSGKTMLVISHDMETIKRVSDRMMLLDQGQVLESGVPSDVVQHYQDMAHVKHRTSLQKEWGTRDVTIEGVDLFDAAGAPRTAYRWDEDVRVRVRYTTRGRIEDPVFGFGISNDDGVVLTGSNCQVEQTPIEAIEGSGAVELRIPRLDLARGTYLLSLSVHSSDHRIQYHRLDNCFPLKVEQDGGFAGHYMPSAWRILPGDAGGKDGDDADA